MLRSIEIENCYSFHEGTPLTFTVNSKAPKSPRYAKSEVEGERISKITGIFGPNGAGKSNLLRIINFVKWFTIDSFGEKPEEDFSLPPFLLKEQPFAPSKIKIEFECKKTIYRYELEISKSAVLCEELQKLDLSEKNESERKRYKRLYIRTYNKKSESYDIKASPDFNLDEGLRELAKKRKNASLISAGVFTNHDPSVEIKNYWAGVTTKIRRSLDRSYPLEYHVMRSTEFYYKNQQFKTKMEDMMARTDLGVVGIDIEKVNLPNPGELESGKQEFYMPFGKHRGLNKKSYRLPFYFESGGTQQIYVLLSTLLPALESGGLAIIDELEADLHPDVIPFLFDLFESSKMNPKNAQLIFTCHALTILQDLHKYQGVIVEKNNEGVSSAKRFDQIENLRSDDNLFTKYLSGFLGGKPNIKRIGK